MVHHRLNEREANPNKHVNFITALPAPDVPAPFSEADARQLLRALAAQVRPVMKSHGFEVNSLEEYEFNQVFAGRNWNNGETVELVLRRPDGTFVSNAWLLSTLCHELAHIKHMNHGRDFQKLWAQLRNEVAALQARGYFGDGYWSSGTRLSDSARIGGEGVDDYGLPEYVCGGAQTRARPKRGAGRRRRAPRQTAGPSNHTGRQTEKKRKAGTRVKSQAAFKGGGQALNADISDDDAKSRGTGFRKQAGSKRAREERAMAAERRLKALQAPKKEDPASSETESESESETESDTEAGPETDEKRREWLKQSMRGDDGPASSKEIMRNFLSTGSTWKASTSKQTSNDSDFKALFDAIELSDDEGKGVACDVPSASNPVNPRPSPSQVDATRPSKRQKTDSAAPSGTKDKAYKPLGIGRMVQEEIATRKREALGLSGGRKLGTGVSPVAKLKKGQPALQEQTTGNAKPEWACRVCTLLNKDQHLACSVCATPRGQSA